MGKKFLGEVTCRFAFCYTGGGCPYKRYTKPILTIVFQMIKCEIYLYYTYNINNDRQ